MCFVDVAGRAGERLQVVDQAKDLVRRPACFVGGVAQEPLEQVERLVQLFGSFSVRDGVQRRCEFFGSNRTVSRCLLCERGELGLRCRNRLRRPLSETFKRGEELQCLRVGDIARLDKVSDLVRDLAHRAGQLLNGCAELIDVALRVAEPAVKVLDLWLTTSRVSFASNRLRAASLLTRLNSSASTRNASPKSFAASATSRFSRA